MRAIPSPAAANILSSFFARDIDVITVTDVADAGRTLQPATPERPVYYMLIDLGQRSLDSTAEGSAQWAGEVIPEQKQARKWIIGALAKQGYKLADEMRPPTQLLVYTWGMVAGSDTVDDNGMNPRRPALKFLGGDKVDLMWEDKSRGGYLDARVLLRGFQRMGVTGKIWDFAGSNLFFGRVRSFTVESLASDKVTLLWETRFACPADGLALADALPMMIHAAAPNFGRGTDMPVNVNASKLFEGRVDLGEIEIVEMFPESNPKK